jgi:rod shape determining protein RodA
MLLSIGLFTLYSLTNTGISSRIEYFQKEFTNQLIYTVIGLLMSVVAFTVPPIYFKFKPVLAVAYIFTIGLLLYTLFFGLDIRGVRRWITIGSRVLEDGTIVGGMTIQASEFAKISTILITSALLSTPVFQNEEARAKLTKVKRFLFENKYVFISLLLNLVIIICIFAQKSLSVTTVTSFIIVAIMFANARQKVLAFMASIAFIISVILSQTIFYDISIATRIGLFIGVLALYIIAVYSEKLNDVAIFAAIAAGVVTGSLVLNFAWNNLIHDFQKQRIEAFMNPNRDAKEEGFQQEQSKISIGAGQILGQGFRQVSDSRLLLLPEPTTDFIFAIFGFKFGFVGATMVVGIYLTLICRLYYLADQMSDTFGSLVLIGVASMILVQFFSNIGMNLDMLPVGGTTLPFISAGGSSLMSMIIGIAVCQNIIATNKVDRNVHQRKDKVMINGWNV